MINYIHLLIKFVPTILFLFIVLFDLLLGYLRGFRKSLIYLIHSIISATIAILLYFLFLNLADMDEFMLKFVNLFMKIGGTTLQSALGVNESCASLQEVFVEYIPTAVPPEMGLEIILRDNGAYLATLVNASYNFCVAILCCLIYYLLDFILTIIYWIFYRDSKFKKKNIKEFAKGKTTKAYHEKKWAGILIGTGRGIVSGIISLSLIGGIFFIVSGDKGTNPVSDYKTGDKNVDEYYQMYQEIGNYGSYGIFKVLNCIEDKNDLPCYLFAIDLIMHGSYEEETEEDGTVTYYVNMRNELSTYSLFAKQTANLLIKYGGDEIRPIILNQSDKDIFTVVTELFADSAFQEEFRGVINGLKSDTFVLSLGLSLINSIASNIDDISFASNLNEETRELIKILFTKGYYSTYINNEREDIYSNNTDKVLPYLNASNIINKADIDNVLQITYRCFENINNDPINLVTSITPYISNLTLLNTNENKINPVFSRLSSYLCDYYLDKVISTSNTEPTEEVQGRIRLKQNELGNSYSYYNDGIKWNKEIKTIISSVNDAINLYNNVYVQDKDILTTILDIFDENNENYKMNVTIYHSLCDKIKTSKGLGKILSSDAINGFLQQTMQDAFSSNYDFPENVQYATDDNGEGEIYYFFKSIEIFGQKENRAVIDQLINSTDDTENDILSSLAAMLNDDFEGRKVYKYFTNSSIIESVLSSTIINNLGDTVYVPKACLETNSNGDKVNIIKKDEFELIFSNLDYITKEVLPLFEEDDASNTISTLIKDDKFMSLLDSKIIQGTIAKQMITPLQEEPNIVLPRKLADPENWVSNDKDKGELLKLIDIFNNTSLDYSQLTGEDDLTTAIMDLSDKDIDIIINSDLVYYSVSYNLINDTPNMNIVVPNVCRVGVKDEDIDAVINKDKLIHFLHSMKELNIGEDIDVNLLMNKVMKDKNRYLSNEIIVGTFVLNSYEDLNDSFDLPTAYQDAATKERLLSNINPWYSEIYRLLSAIDEIYGVSEGNTFDINDDIQSRMSGIVSTWKEPSRVDPKQNRINLIYSSNIVAKIVSSYIDDSLNGDIDNSILTLAKNSEGVFKKNEILALCNIIDVGNINLDNYEDIDLNKVLNSDVPIEETTYSSYLVRHMITGALDDVLNEGNTLIVDHPMAYDNYGGILLLKSTEIKSLMTVLKKIPSKDYKDFNLEDIELADILVLIKNGNDGCGSYLMVAALSNLIKKVNTFVVPDILMDAYGFISYIEMINFLTAVHNMNIDKITQTMVLSQLKIEEENLANISKSKILNATISKNLNSNYQLYSSTNRSSIVGTLKGTNVVLFEEDELYNLLLNTYQLITIDNNSVNIDLSDTFLASLQNKDLNEVMNSCSIIHYYLSDRISQIYGPIYDSSENVNSIDHVSTLLLNCYSIDRIVAVFENM